MLSLYLSPGLRLENIIQIAWPLDSKEGVESKRADQEETEPDPHHQQISHSEENKLFNDSKIIPKGLTLLTECGVSCQGSLFLTRLAPS